jgi:hypothetical protein
MSENNVTYKFFCLVCGCEFHEYFLPCNCQICLECSLDWIKTQNLESLYLDEQFLNCANFECRRKIDKEWLYRNWPANNLNELNEIFLKKHLNSNSIKKCPKSGCNYSGFIESNESQAKCSDPYICDLCKTSWRDADVDADYSTNLKIKNSQKESEYNIYFLLQNLIFLLIIFKKKLLQEITEIRISVFYKSCVHCKRVINKFTGCDHVSCVCKQEFCYNCSKDYTEHLNNLNSCNTSKSLKSFFLVLLSAKFVLKTIFSFNIFILIINYILWLVWVEICGVCAIGLVVLMIVGWITLLFSKIRSRNLKIFVSILVLCGIFLIYKIYNSYEFFRTCTKVIFFESLAILIYIIGYKIKEKFLRRRTLNFLRRRI